MAGAYVVVPRRPGPLLVPGRTGRERDEVDDLLDDLLGEPTDERSGLLDLALIVAGGALAGATLLAAAPIGVAVLGAGLAGLGLVLPARDAWRGFGRRRNAGREAALRALGHPLDVTHPETCRLADRYTRIVAGAAGPGLGPDAAEAAHLAVVEVAVLLAGRPPAGAEIAYVTTRADALADLALALERATAAARQVRDEIESLARDAGVAAVSELDERSATGAIARIDAVRAMLEPDGP